jgi:hypothetical protein
MSIVTNGGDTEDYNWMCDELDGDPHVWWCERRTPLVSGGAVYSISCCTLFIYDFAIFLG